MAVTCRQVAAWINWRCKENMDARTERPAGGEVVLVHTLAPWVAEHWAQCAAINRPPSGRPGEDGQCHCQTLDATPRQLDAPPVQRGTKRRRR